MQLILLMGSLWMTVCFHLNKSAGIALYSLVRFYGKMEMIVLKKKSASVRAYWPNATNLVSRVHLPYVWVSLISEYGPAYANIYLSIWRTHSSILTKALFKRIKISINSHSVLYHSIELGSTNASMLCIALMHLEGFFRYEGIMYLTCTCKKWTIILVNLK